MPSRSLLELLLNDCGARTGRLDGITDDVLHSLLHRSALAAFENLLRDAGIETLVAILESPHQALSGTSQRGDRASFARQIYRQLKPDFGVSAGFEEFDTRFSRFLQTLSGLIDYTRAPKLIELPGREFGETGIGKLASLQAPEELAGYMAYLVTGFKDRGALSPRAAEHLAGLIEKISSAPGYLQYLHLEKKHGEVARLFNTVRGLQSYGQQDDPATRDLLVSIGILLFNLSPSEKIVSFLSSVRPSPASPALLYHYCSVLALNHLLSGRPDPAEAFASCALKSATDGEKKAYIHMLRGCISISRGDYGRAVASFREATASLMDEDASAVSGRFKGLIAFYTGVVLFETGEYANAIAFFEDAGRHVSDALDQATVHNNIGLCALQIGDEARAYREFQATERLSSRLKGTQASQCMLLVSSYKWAIHGSLDDTEKAIGYYRRALKLASGRGDHTAVANLLGNLGATYAKMGNFGPALRALNACMAHAERHGYWEGIRFAFWHIYHTLLAVDRDEARRFREAYASKYPELRDL